MIRLNLSRNEGGGKSKGKPRGKKTKLKMPKANGIEAKKMRADPQTLKKINGKRSKLAEEEISSDSDSDVEEAVTKSVETSSDDEELTEQERRLKLAKKYLSQLEEEEQDGSEAISQRLKQDVLDKTGQLQRKIADECQFKTILDIKVLRGHKLSLTCLVISHDDKYAFSASKDGSLIKWCLSSFRRLKQINGGPKNNPNVVGHYAIVTSLALSTDTKFLASGDDAKIIRIWNPENLSVIRDFIQHQKPITGLAFRVSSHQLFSTSADRSVKIWNLDEMGYVETLFGHQDSITSIDSLVRDRALTSGGRDCTVRLWKIPEEAHLVFQGSAASIDCVSFINEQHFISGADDGSISIWGLQKKKPLHVVPAAHGQQVNKENNWITALTALSNSDLVASGSQDGFIRVWKCNQDFKGLVLLAEVPVVGFVNGLKFSKTGSFLLAAVGQEHRGGRWWRIKEAKNSLVVIPLKTDVSTI